jgi:methionyl-tRNA formyltransferase
MRVDREMDAGPVALTREIEIGADESAGDLTIRLGELAADALESALEEIDAGTVAFAEQDHSAATVACKLTREMGELRFTESAATLVRRVRAFAPKPGAYTHLEGELLRIYAAHVETSGSLPEPGTIAVDNDKTIRIATGEGWLVPTRVQRAGGKEMSVDAFLRGRPIPDGSKLDAATSPEPNDG